MQQLTQKRDRHFSYTLEELLFLKLMDLLLNSLDSTILILVWTSYNHALNVILFIYGLWEPKQLLSLMFKFTIPIMLILSIGKSIEEKFSYSLMDHLAHPMLLESLEIIGLFLIGHTTMFLNVIILM